MSGRWTDGTFDAHTDAMTDVTDKVWTVGISTGILWEL